MGYCYACWQEKTVFGPARKKRVERIARRIARRSAKLREAA
jgi:hypothetical protein